MQEVIRTNKEERNRERKMVGREGGYEQFQHIIETMQNIFT